MTLLLEPAALCLAIMAGGHGTRLGGRAKGLLQHNGVTLLERLLTLSPLADQRFIVSNSPSEYRRFGVEIVPDLPAHVGAPAGVVSALAASTKPWVLVVACDQPGLTQAVVQPLLETDRANAEVICFERGGRYEPFPGLYSAALAAHWEAQLTQQTSLQRLLGSARTRALACASPDQLDSINTPADLERWQVS